MQRWGRSYYSNLFPLTDSFKEIVFELLNTKKIKYFNFNVHGEHEYNTMLNDNEKKNYFHILLMYDDLYQIKKIFKSMNITIKEDFMKYAKSKATKDFLKDNLIKNLSEAKIIVFSDLDKKMLEQKNQDSIDDFIAINNYKITENSIILSCQKNIKFKLIQHLMASKINFTENGVNEIIKSYRKDKNISNLLLQINGYYKFTQNNYYEMVLSPYYHEIFTGELLHGVIFDDKITDLFLDAVKINGDKNEDNNEDYNYYGAHHNYDEKMQKKFIVFLNNIKDLAAKSEENTNNILALYCFHGDDKEITNFVKEFKCKMTTKSLKFLYKNKGNIKKKVMELFIKDNIKPDFDVLLQYIDTYSRRKEQQFIFDLLGIE
jgi:hypothetical protein